MSMFDFELGIAGLPEVTIAELNKQAPALVRLAAAAKQAEPLIAQLLPIITKAYPDVVAVTPLAQQLTAFVAAKSQSG